MVVGFEPTVIGGGVITLWEGMQKPLSQRAERVRWVGLDSIYQASQSGGVLRRQIAEISVRCVLDEVGRLAVSASHPIRDWWNVDMEQRCTVHEKEHEKYIICAKCELSTSSFGRVWDIWEVLRGKVATSLLLRRDDSLHGAMYDYEAVMPSASRGWWLGPRYQLRLARGGSSTMVGGRCSRCRSGGIGGETRGDDDRHHTPSFRLHRRWVYRRGSLCMWRGFLVCKAVTGCRQWCDRSMNSDRTAYGLDYMWRVGVTCKGWELHEGVVIIAYAAEPDRTMGVMHAWDVSQTPRLLTSRQSTVWLPASRLSMRCIHDVVVGARRLHACMYACRRGKHADGIRWWEVWRLVSQASPPPLHAWISPVEGCLPSAMCETGVKWITFIIWHLIDVIVYSHEYTNFTKFWLSIIETYLWNTSLERLRGGRPRPP